MNKVNITDEILALHDKEFLDKIDKVVKEKCINGFTEETRSKARQLMAMADERLKPKNAKVVEVNFAQNKKAVTETHADNVVSFEAFGEFELLAAASKDSDVKWYEQIITVGAIDGRGGCLLEINPYGEGSKEVKITLSAEAGSESVIKQMLNKFAGKTVDVEISLAGNPILSAEIDVTPEASEAEGMGVIQQFERPDTKNAKLKIGFVIKK